MQINIYMKQAATEALGPGRRYALWVQGCKRRCKGCISPDSRSFDKGDRMDTAALAEEIIHTENIEGITISGGEPFLQAEALCEVIGRIKAAKDFGVMIYTGDTYEQLCSSTDRHVKKLLSFTDILIDGEYIDEFNDGRSLRGSSNQRVFFLTVRYQADQGLFGRTGRNVELYVKGGRTRMVGIPSRDILEKLGIAKEDSNERD